MSPRAAGRLRVVLTTELFAAEDVAWFRETLNGATVEHVAIPWRDGGSSVASRLAAADEEVVHAADVIVGMAEQLPDLPRRAPGLRLIQHGGTGWDAVDIEGLANAGIGFASAAGTGGLSVADFGLAALLSIWMRHDERQLNQAEHRWERLPTGEIPGRRVLVLGAGVIGSRLAHTLGALGAEVTCARRRPEEGPPPGARHAISVDQLDDALPDADALIVAVPLSEETHRLIGMNELSRLPPHAVLVNVARGPIVDQEAVAAQLRAGRLAGAWLDVFETEPLDPGSPLWETPRLRVSSHDATATLGYWRRVLELTRSNIDAWRAGRPLRNQVVAPPAFTGGA